MSVGTDQHIWTAAYRPETTEDTLVLAEMAGPRAIHRTLMVHNDTDVAVAISTCYSPSKSYMAVIPFYAVTVPPDGAFLMSERGSFPALKTKLRNETGNPQVLGGSMPGMEIWVQADVPPTEGSVNLEVSLQFDS